MSRSIRTVLAALLLNASPAMAAQNLQHWVATWGAAQQLPEPANELPAEHWRDASLRQVVRLSLGGSRLRVRISNAYGSAPLVVEGASIALAQPGKADIDATTLRPLTFDGRGTVMIPAGAEYYSDAVDMTVKPAADLAVSLYFKGEPARQTGHPGSRAASFLAKGNRVMDAAWADAGSIAHWYMLADVEVRAPATTGALVVVGDSITDGYGVAPDSNTRWTDALSARLRQSGAAIGVVNAGIGGGRMLRDGLGTSLAARFDRDVLSRAGVTHALVLIGVNDLGSQHRNTPDLPADRQQLLADLQTAHRQLAERAHAHGICLIGATITPYKASGYYHPEAENEADRQALNDWIRHSGVFDAVADTDAALRDPAQPQLMSKDYDSGDGLHPSAAGYRAIANAVPLAALRSSCRETR
ncbi:MAG: SGNH/GDSL hydrolase family protein [Pseudomonadota bacterium]